MPLGRDPGAISLARFSGRLNNATLTQQTSTPYDVNNPTAAPSSVPVAHACEGLAFTYANRDIDGTRVLKNDYRVVLLRASLAVMPATDDKISIAPPGESVAIEGTVIRVEAVTDAQVTMQVRR